MKTDKLDIQEKIGDRNPFAVPENYFEDFATQMETQISAEQVNVKKLFKPWMYMAAMFVGILMMGHVFFAIYKQHQTKKEAELYELYLLSQLDYAVEYDLYLDSQSD